MRKYFILVLVAIYLAISFTDVFAQSGQENSFTNQLISALIGGLISGSVISVIFHKRMTRIQEEIRTQFEILRSQREWKEQSVSELLGPINMLLDRTDRAFERWEANAVFLEAEIIAKSNKQIRDLLLEKGHLIPPELLEDAGKLVEHYDKWLEAFEENREKKEPQHQEPFTFVGPQGYPFPEESADRFQEYFKKYWNDLYKPK